MSNIIPESEVIPILLFIVPGFISLSIRRSLQPTQNAGEWDKIINCFIYSLVILFFLSLVGISADQLIIWSWIGAIVFGILLTVMDIFKPYMFDFFRYIHLTDFSGRQSIWDDAFPQTNKTYWIRAEVSDDLAYLGVLKSKKEFQENAHLQLENVHIITSSNDEPVKSNPKLNVVINTKNLKYLELLEK